MDKKYSSVKRNEPICMNLKNVKLNQRRQTQNTTCYMIPFIKNFWKRKIIETGRSGLPRPRAGGWIDCKRTRGMAAFSNMGAFNVFQGWLYHCIQLSNLIKLCT